MSRITVKMNIGRRMDAQRTTDVPEDFEVTGRSGIFIIFYLDGHHTPPHHNKSSKIRTTCIRIHR